MFLYYIFIEFDGIEIHSKITYNEPNRKDVEDENERGGELTGPTVCLHIICWYYCNRLFSVLASSAVDRGFESRSGQTKDYKMGICCFSAKHAVLRVKSKDWLTRNQDNVPEWGDKSIRGLLFHWASTIKIQLSVLV